MKGGLSGTQCTPVGHTNYKRTNWEEFTNETEQHFTILNSIPITNNKNIAVHTFTIIMQNADRNHIPRGNRKIQDLIKQRDTLQHFSTPPIYTTQRIHALNTQIYNKIQEQQTLNWNRFLQTLNTSKLPYPTATQHNHTKPIFPNWAPTSIFHN